MGDFLDDRRCVTHHNACDCREEYFKQLEAENKNLKDFIKWGEREDVYATWLRKQDLEKGNRG